MSATEEACASGDPFAVRFSEHQPSALIVTIPKSGTVFLRSALAKNFGLTTAIISNQYFPIDQLRLFETIQFAAGRMVAAAHIDASPANLQILDAFIRRWVVHVRDPRSVVLSWTHHIERLWQEGRRHHLLLATPCPEPSYHNLSFEARLDWQINNFVPSVINWIDVWVRLADAHPDRILLTEFSDMRANEQRFITKLSEFLGLTFETGAYVPIEKTMDTAHFRVGHTDEWRSALTPSQQRAINEIIPRELVSRFGWPSE